MTRPFLVAFLGMALLTGCGRASNPLDFAPELDPEIAGILVAGADSMLTEYGLTHGVYKLIWGIAAFRHSVSLETRTSFLESQTRAQPYMLRIARCLASDFSLTGYLAEQIRIGAMSYRQRLRAVELEERRMRLIMDTKLSPEERYRMAEELRKEFDAIDPFSWQSLSTFVEQAKARDQLGQYDLELQCYRRLLYRARRAGGTIHLPRYTGIVGYVLGKTGNADPDSIWIYYEEARRLAFQMRLPSESVFALRMMASLHRREGRIAQAHALIMEAQQVAREFRAGFFEWDALHSAIDLNARLGAWSVVRELLLRSRSVFAEYADTVPDNLSEMMAGDLRRMEGAVLMANGDIQAGSRLFAEAEEEVKKRPHREHYAIHMHDWGEGLLEAGRPTEALPVLGRGYSYANGVNLPSHRIRLAPLYAQALLETGRLEEARNILDEFRAGTGTELVDYPREWLRHDLVRLRLARRVGPSDGVDPEVRNALAHLETILTDLDGSEPTYLFLDAAQALREEIHEVLAADPPVGYGFELYWRSLGRHLGEPVGEDPGYRMAGKSASSSGIRHAFRVRAGLQLDRLRKRKAQHWVYFAGKTSVLRWTANGYGIERETLKASTRELDRHVREAITLLERPLPAGPSPEGLRLHRLLVQLGEDLIPPLGPSRTAPELYLISPDRFLNALPFGALTVVPDQDSYSPLLDLADVAYLRFDGDPGLPATIRSPGILVADPTHSPEFWRRYPTLSGLPNTVEETETILARSPGSQLLKQDTATKRTLLETWEHASFLYIAAHFVRDTELPYLVFLPLAPDSTAPGSTFLELSPMRQKVRQRGRDIGRVARRAPERGGC